MSDPSDTETYGDPESMVEAFYRIFGEHRDYYEVCKPLVRFYANGEAYQWTYGVDFSADSVHQNRDSIAFDPDDKTYSEGGLYVECYNGEGLRDPHVAVRDEAPELGVNVDEKQHKVCQMVVDMGVKARV